MGSTLARMVKMRNLYRGLVGEPEENETDWKIQT
jgi:hypothetical protein